ncbi:MAG: glucoamylase family protein [Planctomycetota bacterium]
MPHDLTQAAGVFGSIRKTLVLATAVCCVLANSAVTTAADASDTERFLDDVQRRTFNWFWETTSPDTGLTPDRWPKRTASSVAAIGFGLTAYGVGADHGWVSREAAAERTLATLRFLSDLPQNAGVSETSGYRGFYYHFLRYGSGHRWRTCELSSIDTALLMMGVLYAREYYDGPSEDEREIRRLATELYERVQWDWMQPRAPLMAMAWRPEPPRRGPSGGRADGGHYSRSDYRGYDEALFLYALAVGSPTHPIDPGAWDAYTASNEWAEFYGEEHINFSPLFGHQFFASWISPRTLQDDYLRGKGIDYFENSRRATLAQRAYAIANPAGFVGYGPDVWGLTACDGPGAGGFDSHGERVPFRSYWARGASARRVNDDGTIAPYAAGASMPFTPEASIAALRTMHERYGEHLYAEYGFLDSFNLCLTDTRVDVRHGKVVDGAGWFNGDYLGIDQGPLLLMIENHRTGGVWRVMRGCEPLRRGLTQAGFTADWLAE